MLFKTEVYKACQEHDYARKLRAAVKCSDLYYDLENRDEVLKTLEKLSKHIFNKIEA